MIYWTEPPGHSVRKADPFAGSVYPSMRPETRLLRDPDDALCTSESTPKTASTIAINWLWTMNHITPATVKNATPVTKGLIF